MNAGDAELSDLKLDLSDLKLALDDLKRDLPEEIKLDYELDSARTLDDISSDVFDEDFEYLNDVIDEDDDVKESSDVVEQNTDDVVSEDSQSQNSSDIERILLDALQNDLSKAVVSDDDDDDDDDVSSFSSGDTEYHMRQIAIRLNRA